MTMSDSSGDFLFPARVKGEVLAQHGALRDLLQRVLDATTLGLQQGGEVAHLADSTAHLAESLQHNPEAGPLARARDRLEHALIEAEATARHPFAAGAEA